MGVGNLTPLPKMGVKRELPVLRRLRKSTLSTKMGEVP